MFKKMMTFIAIFLFQLPVYADNTAAKDLSVLLTNLNAVKADFTQIITDKNAKQIQQSVGQMYMQRPGKFRWDVKKPAKQLVVTNGKKIWIYDPDLEQVTIRALTKEVGESPAMLLTNPNTTIEKDYQVENIKASAKDLQWFSLVPRNQNSMFAKIKLGFNKNQIREMELQDHIGHTTSIAFYNISMNPVLSDTLFSFKPPAHVDVIDETRR
jgi:outer membrane lipoprotein carrier protein